ncbi:MAG: MMPL family transporter [Acidobacteria bacterium]|nr:MMPL family transporter [Acidobacteriota bacterium]
MPRLHQFRQRQLTRIANLTCSHPLAVVVAAGLVTLLAIFGLTRLHFETGLADYLPEDSPVVRLFSRAVAHYGSSDHLVVVLRGDEEDADARKVFADQIATRLEASGMVDSVQYRFGSEGTAGRVPAILDYALYYLDDNGLAQFADSLKAEKIRDRVRANRRLLLSPASMISKELVQRDPLGLRDLFASRFRRLKGNLNLRFFDGYAFSQDLEMLVMLVKPVQPAQNLTFTEELLARTGIVLEEARVATGEEIGEEALAGVITDLTGGYPIVADYTSLLKNDMGWTIATAFVGVMLLFLLAFRRIGSLLYVGVPLLVGLVWTMGFAGLTIGRLNLFTAAAATILLGLSIDFAIHLFNRYVGERDRGRTMDEAIHCAIVETGSGILTAALTTVAAFAACTITPIDGLVQLGIICGVGMILNLVANFFLLPALLMLRGGRRHRESYKDASFNFGLGATARFVTRYPLAVVVFWGGLAGLFLWGLLTTSIDTDFRSLRPDSSRAIQVQRELTRKIGSGLIYSLILIDANSEAEAQARNVQVARRLDKLVESGEVIFYLSLASVIPPADRQRQVLAWLENERREEAGALDVDRIAADLSAAMTEAGFRLGQSYQDTVSLLRRVLSLERELTLEGIHDQALHRFADRFVYREGDTIELATYVYPSRRDGSGQYKLMEYLEEHVLAGVEDANVIGVAILGRELKRLIREGSIEAAFLAMGLVLAILWTHFRRLSYVVLTAVPLLLGELGALGGMTLLGHNLNMVSMGIIPIILGIGIDDGIHIVHRFMDQGEKDVPGVFRFAGRAVVITSMTTIVGFGSLIFSSYKGLWSAGLFAILGVGICLLASITLLPALLQIFVVGRRERAAG